MKRSDAESHEMALEVESADVVYLTGGSPIHLLETLRESAVLAAILKVLERGSVLAGFQCRGDGNGKLDAVPRVASGVGRSQDGIASLPHHERADSSAVSREISE